MPVIAMRHLEAIAKGTVLPFRIKAHCGSGVGKIAQYGPKPRPLRAVNEHIETLLAQPCYHGRNIRHRKRRALVNTRDQTDSGGIGAGHEQGNMHVGQPLAQGGDQR